MTNTQQKPSINGEFPDDLARALKEQVRGDVRLDASDRACLLYTSPSPRD